MHKYKVFVLLVLAASLLLAFTPTVSPAFAATTRPARASVVQGEGNAIFPVAHSLAHVAPQAKSVGPGGNAIICNGTVTMGLASGYIVAQAEILCSQNVAVIFNSLLLYRNGGLYGSSTQTQSGVYYVYRDVVKRCSSQYHNWQAYLTGGVTFPAGYEPASVAVDVGTASVRYHC
jgi:hypothetical protein